MRRGSIGVAGSARTPWSVGCDEDREAARRLGAEALPSRAAGRHVPGGYASAAGRSTRTFWLSWADPGPATHCDRCCAGRSSELPECDLLILPFAIGGHVDHRLTRGIAETVCAGQEVAYWEDFPYLARLFRPGPRPNTGWQSELVKLSAEALEARCRAMADYASQVRTMFGDEARMRRRVQRAVRRRGGERYWRRPF